MRTFPINEVHENCHVTAFRDMCKAFVRKNYVQIDRIADQVICRSMSVNTDVLTKGKQTVVVVVIVS